MGEAESGTAGGSAGTDGSARRSNNNAGTVVLQLTIWQQYL
jgi:hypothetical protein